MINFIIHNFLFHSYYSFIQDIARPSSLHPTSIRSHCIEFHWIIMFWVSHRPKRSHLPFALSNKSHILQLLQASRWITSEDQLSFCWGSIWLGQQKRRQKIENWTHHNNKWILIFRKACLRQSMPTKAINSLPDEHFNHFFRVMNMSLVLAFNYFTLSSCVPSLK